MARALVGAELWHGPTGGRIVETEAYADDSASHFVTRRHQGKIMLDTCGCIYIYRIYGQHHCLNFTTSGHGVGAVLIRSLEPLGGLSTMARRRGTDRVRDLARGPGRLGQALGIRPEMNGLPVLDVFRLVAGPSGLPVLAGPRIGVTSAVDLRWRFHLEGSPFVSHRYR